MKNEKINRRTFVREGSAIVAGGAASAALSAGSQAAPSLDPKQIINYHPKMRYRTLGKTKLVVSEISFGGHWSNRGGGTVWDQFAGDQVPPDVGENRTEVISAAIDCGMNYLDITTSGECLAYGVALAGRREKMIVGADDHRLCPRNPDNQNVKAQVHNVEECLRRLKMDYLDIWRVQARQAGGHSDEQVRVWIEAFQKLRDQGKAKHFGISTHCRPWIQHVVETFPEVEMVVFPCTATTRAAGQPPTAENVVEGNMPVGWKADTSKSIFTTLQEKNVGLVTIKPFVGGSLFKTPRKFPVLGVGTKEENDLARLTLQCILTNQTISAVVVGMTTVYEAENAAKASYRRTAGMTPRETRWVARRMEQAWQNLPEHYEWLRDWQVV